MEVCWNGTLLPKSCTLAFAAGAPLTNVTRPVTTPVPLSVTVIGTTWPFAVIDPETSVNRLPLFGLNARTVNTPTGTFGIVSLPAASVDPAKRKKLLLNISTELLAAGAPLAKFTCTDTVPRPTSVRLIVEVWFWTTPTWALVPTPVFGSRAVTVKFPTGTSSNVYRPVASVTVERPIPMPNGPICSLPLRLTCTPTAGAPAPVNTRPVIVPVG